VETRNTIEVVLTSGQKLQFGNASTAWVQRPNRLRAEREGDLVDQIFLYDGKSLTLYNPGQKYYATVAAPGTLDQILDFARTSLDVIAPGSDLLYANAYEILMENVTSRFVVGKGVVEGVRCDHLAFLGRGSRGCRAVRGARCSGRRRRSAARRALQAYGGRAQRGGSLPRPNVGLLPARHVEGDERVTVDVRLGGDADRLHRAHGRRFVGGGDRQCGQGPEAQGRGGALHRLHRCLHCARRECLRRRATGAVPGGFRPRRAD
jgi:hypothetical protein